jgi:hypothetical protein
MGNKVGVFKQRDLDELSEGERNRLRAVTLKALIESDVILKLIRNDPALAAKCRDAVKSEMGDTFNTLREKERSRGEPA